MPSLPFFAIDVACHSLAMNMFSNCPEEGTAEYAELTDDEIAKCEALEARYNALGFGRIIQQFIGPTKMKEFLSKSFTKS
jgi:hypothetical protein